MNATSPVARLRFRRAPLAAAAVWFAAGIAANHFAHLKTAVQPTWLLLAALAVLLGIACAAMRGRVGWVPVAGLWVVLGVAASEWQPGPVRPLKLLGFADDLTRIVRGRVVRVRVSPPPADTADEDAVQPWESTDEVRRGEQSITLDLAVEEVEDLLPDTAYMVPVEGGIRVTVYLKGAEQMNLGCGDRVEVPVALTPPDRYRDPGAFAYADYLLGQGIAARGNVAAAKVKVLGSSEATLPCRLAAAQAWASGRLAGYAGSAQNRRLPPFLRLTQADALMLDAMLFGDRTGLTHTLRTGFERTGSFHLFVVSGLHIALLAGALYWLLRRARAPDWLATAGTLVGTAAYAALTGFGQPAQRALGMTAIYLLARLLSRDRDSLNALGAAALAMLVWSPRQSV